MGKKRELGVIEYRSGDPSVPLEEDYRFSTWEHFPTDFLSWEKHFDSHGIPTAIGQSNMGFALFVPRRQL